MKHFYKRSAIRLLAAITMVMVSSCYKEEVINVPVKQYPVSDDPIDIYIQENYLDEFDVAVRYKYVDRYVDPTKRVTPPRREVVVPMLEFLKDLWYEPFAGVDNGEEFFKDHVPAEIVLIGSSIFNDDGTVTLGVADAGARITLTEVNDIDEENSDWVLRQLGTIYHEFAHIIHQRYNLPTGWQKIAPDGYTSVGSWYNLTDEEALRRGFVSPYATSSYNEDFAETVAFLLFDKNFYTTYYNDEVCTGGTDCTARNEGRALLRKKYSSVIAHYKQYVGVDLLEVRALVQEKLQ